MRSHDSVLVVALLTASMVISTALVEYTSGHPFPGTENPLIATQVFLRKVILHTATGTDDGLDGCTELVITTNAYIEGHEAWTWGEVLKFDNDADGNSTYEVLDNINQMIYFHAQCSEPTGLRYKISFIEDEGGFDVSDILKQASGLVGKFSQAVNTWISAAIDYSNYLNAIINDGTFLNANEYLGYYEVYDAHPAEGVHTETWDSQNFTVVVEITRYGVPIECPQCGFKCYNDFMKGLIESFGMDKELQKKIMNDDLENRSSLLPNYEFFREDIFGGGSSIVALAEDVEVEDTEDWNETELAAWKTDFTDAVTDLLNLSAYTVFDVATQFAPYTSKPEYLNEMQSAEQELLLAWEALSLGNTSDAYSHLHYSWQHSWNAMIAADETPPASQIAADRTAVLTGESISFSGFGSYDAAGPSTYYWMANYFWVYGDGSYGSGVATQHAYAHAGTYVVTLDVTDRSGNVDRSYLTISVRAPGYTDVGGLVVPADKLALSAPYVGLASAVLFTVVAAAIHFKHGKRKKTAD